MKTDGGHDHHSTVRLQGLDLEEGERAALAQRRHLVRGALHLAGADKGDVCRMAAPACGRAAAGSNDCVGDELPTESARGSTPPVCRAGLAAVTICDRETKEGRRVERCVEAVAQVRRGVIQGVLASFRHDAAAIGRAGVLSAELVSGAPPGRQVSARSRWPEV